MKHEGHCGGADDEGAPPPACLKGCKGWGSEGGMGNSG